MTARTCAAKGHACWMRSEGTQRVVRPARNVREMEEVGVLLLRLGCASAGGLPLTTYILLLCAARQAINIGTMPSLIGPK